MPNAVKQELLAGMNRLRAQSPTWSAASLKIWEGIVQSIKALPDSPASTPSAGIRTLGLKGQAKGKGKK